VGFEIQIPASASLPHRAALRVARPFLDWALGLPTYRRLHRQAAEAAGSTFTARALQTLNISVALESGDLAALPADGPLLVVSNHPHGMLDGLALAHLVHHRRRDVRVLTSHLLSQIEDLADLCLFVDPFGGRSAAARSRTGLRAARKWLDAGRALIVFPAGSVAHMRSSGGETAIDSPWHATAARLALATGAEIVPAFIRGSNSPWFYHAGRVHERLRTLLLGRELLNHRDRPVAIRLGRPLSTAAIAEDAITATARFRLEVEALAEPFEPERGPACEPLAAWPSAHALASEVQALEAEALLMRSGRFDVYCAGRSSLPLVLQEIGRLRELSFRAVGEGTGNATDLDNFDDHYLHLFVWNRETREVVGAYRLGLIDEIVARHGIEGLYTSTLFRYDGCLVARLSPAIELGRSFVRAEYQRSSNALLLLWKGIARFVARSRKYRVLFGPVSISSRYGETSQQLLKTFLAQNFYDRDLATLVEALTPPSMARIPRGVDARVFDDVGALDRTVAGLEADGKGIPVLLRQYLKLNAKLLGFNVDPNFGDALDALMMVDLRDVEPAVLRRYFGADAEQFVSSSRAAAA
jgi:putative hemolysin